MRLFVYGLNGSQFSLKTLFKTAVELSAAREGLYGDQDDCLMRHCNLGVATNTPNGSYGKQGSNFRQFTSDVPVILRLLQSCTLVDDPEKADGA